MRSHEEHQREEGEGARAQIEAEGRGVRNNRGGDQRASGASAGAQKGRARCSPASLALTAPRFHDVTVQSSGFMVHRQAVDGCGSTSDSEL